MADYRWFHVVRHAPLTETNQDTTYEDLVGDVGQIDTKQSNTTDLLFYFSILTFFFVLLQVSFFLQCHQVYLSEYNTFFNDDFFLPISIMPALALFLLVQCVIHIAFCILTWCFTISVTSLTSFFSKHVLTTGLLIYFLNLTFILIANAYYFPNSHFSKLTRAFIPAAFEKWVLCICCLVLIPILLLTVILFVRQKRLWAGLLAAGFGLFLFYPLTMRPFSAATTNKPNIIIVGVDAMRPDFLGLNGSHLKTEFIDTWLKQSSVFQSAMTPLARTFPTWMSILTGEHPKDHGLRTDLSLHSKKQPTLSSELQQMGYETLYASDETRFSNIDHHYGFDKIITPPIGLNDFLIGTINDFPMSNLLVNTTMGQWLFPYNFGNRAAYHTYDPNSFLHLLKPAIIAKHEKPLFLAVHFCLPHYPYMWHDSPLQTSAVKRYEQSIQRVDQQIAEFFALLKAGQLLDHAIVVLLSDHGEALALSGDRVTEANKYITNQNENPVPHFYPQSLDGEAVNQSAGHGTDVLSLTQYHTVLAFRLYGLIKQPVGTIDDPVSLTQIKPTIQNILQPTKTISGSLYAYLLSPHTHRPIEHILIESDFSPVSIHTVHPETINVIKEGIELFRITKDLRLVVKDNMEQMIVDSKQYADRYGHWILALYPEPNHTKKAILVNLKTGEWTDDLHTSFAKRSPQKQMYDKLINYFSIEKKEVVHK